MAGNTANLIIKADSSQLEKVLKVLDAVGKEAKQLETATDKLTKSIDKLGDESKQTASQLDKVDAAAGKSGKGFTSMSKGALLATGAIAAGAAVAATFVAVGKKVIENTIAQEEAQAQLKATMQSMGTYTEEAYQANLKFASSLQEVSTFGDEAIINMQSVLGTFGNITDTAPRATQAILDMSTKMGTNLKDGAIQVGKALNDPVKGISALTRVGVQFTDEQKDVIASLQETGDMAGAQTIILKELEKQFGGSALAARNTLGGALQALENQWNDLFEASEDTSSGLTSSINELTALLAEPEVKTAMQTLAVILVEGLKKIVEFTAAAVTSIRELLELFDIIENKDLAVDLLIRKNELEEELDNIAAGTPLSTFYYEVKADPNNLTQIEQDLAAYDAKIRTIADLFPEAPRIPAAVDRFGLGLFDFPEDIEYMGEATAKLQEYFDIVRELNAIKPNAQEKVPAVNLPDTPKPTSNVIPISDEVKAFTDALRIEREMLGATDEALLQYNITLQQTAALKKLGLDEDGSNQKEIDQVNAAVEARVRSEDAYNKETEAKLTAAAASQTLNDMYREHIESTDESAAINIRYIDTLASLEEQENDLLAIGALTEEQERRLLELRAAALEQKTAEDEALASRLTQSQQVLQNLTEELELMQMTDEQRAKSIALKEAGANATEAEKTAIEGKIEAIMAEQEAQAMLDELQGTFMNNALNAFDGLIDGSKSAKEAFSDFANQMLKDIARMILKLLILKAIQSVTGMGGGAAAGVQASSAPVRGFSYSGMATGGGISPQGTYEINEMGSPEILNMGGRQYLLPTGQSGTISPTVGNSNVVNVTIDARGSDDPGKIMELVPIIEERVMRTMELKQTRGF